MASRIEFDAAAEKDLDALDPQIARRIIKFLLQRVALLDDPRSLGEALQGKKFRDLWKYRVGDYRLICKIEDDRLLVVVVKVGHRREVYR